MKKLRLIGGQIISPLEVRFADLLIVGDQIEEIVGRGEASPDFENVDVTGKFVTPGLFDLQLNGGPALDFWGELSDKALEKFTHDQAIDGVTSFLPTLITADIDFLVRNIQWLNAHGLNKNLELGKSLSARLPGVHLEGPCLSPKRPGVHPPEFVTPLTEETLKRLIIDGVSLMTMAPETDPDGKALQYLIDHGVKPSLGHSNATFEEANKAFNAGVTMMTHTFNALPPLHHRSPGAVGAAFLNDNVTCCVIADGLHLAPEMVSIIIKMKGREHTILVTDAAKIGTTGGGLVGSSIHLADAVRNCVAWGSASFVDAIRMASFNPAKALGLDEKIGHIEKGKKADLVVWDEASLKVDSVYVDGRKVEKNEAVI
ncbi:MAG: amidohydrolase family protein [Leptolyngbya sp.]|nr:amidohydrolase family protein [Candidatus Melainabacteria bacterium]